MINYQAVSVVLIVDLAQGSAGHLGFGHTPGIPFFKAVPYLANSIQSFGIRKTKRQELFAITSFNPNHSRVLLLQTPAWQKKEITIDRKQGQIPNSRIQEGIRNVEQLPFPSWKHRGFAWTTLCDRAGITAGAENWVFNWFSFWLLAREQSWKGWIEN